MTAGCQQWLLDSPLVTETQIITVEGQWLPGVSGGICMIPYRNVDPNKEKKSAEMI